MAVGAYSVTEWAIVTLIGRVPSTTVISPSGRLALFWESGHGSDISVVAVGGLHLFSAVESISFEAGSVYGARWTGEWSFDLYVTEDAVLEKGPRLPSFTVRLVPIPSGSMPSG